MTIRQITVALAAALLLGAAGPAPAEPPSDPSVYLAAAPKPASVRGRFSVVSVGDVMLARPQAATDDPELKKVLEAIRAGDVAIGNQEGPALDLTALPRGTFGMFGGLVAQPGMPADYRAMGFDLMSVANNHSTDWGGDGLLRALKLLDEAGVAHAGGGASMTEARRAGFAQTPKGRVGLVATASTFKANARAGDAGPLAPDQSGISTLRTRTLNLVTAEQFAAIRRLATELASPLKPAPPADAKEVVFDDQIYRVADKPGLAYQMDLIDHTALLKAVHDGKAQADLLVFHIHAHETPTGVDDDTPQPPDFLVKLFHDAVDAGADVVMGGGPHALRGVEIYRGKPIFYGLGLFFFKPQLMGAAESGARAWPDDGYPPQPDPRPNNPPAGTTACWRSAISRAPS